MPLLRPGRKGRTGRTRPQDLSQRTRRLRSATVPPEALAQANRAYLSLLETIHAIALQELDPWIAEHARIDASSTFILDRVKKRIEDFFRSKELFLAVNKSVASIDRGVDRDLQKIPGIDPATILPAGEQQIAAFRTRNVELIKTVPREYLNDIAATLASTDVRNLTARGIRDVLQERFGVNRSRAELWARDQTLKLNAEITKERHTALGIQEYIWTTSDDERVRDKHKELDGKRFRYDNPPVTDKRGRRNNPGEDFQCRCTAYPVLPEPEE